MALEVYLTRLSLVGTARNDVKCSHAPRDVLAVIVQIWSDNRWLRFVTPDVRYGTSSPIS